LRPEVKPGDGIVHELEQVLGELSSGEESEAPNEAHPASKVSAKIPPFTFTEEDEPDQALGKRMTQWLQQVICKTSSQQHPSALTLA